MKKILLSLILLTLPTMAMETDKRDVAPSPTLVTRAATDESLQETLLQNSLESCYVASTAYKQFSEELNALVQRFARIIKSEEAVVSWPELETSINATFAHLETKVSQLPLFLDMLTKDLEQSFYNPSLTLTTFSLVDLICDSNDALKAIAMKIIAASPTIQTKMQEIADRQKALEESGLFSASITTTAAPA